MSNLYKIYKYYIYIFIIIHMKNIFSMLSFEKLTCELKKVLYRFPVGFIAIIITALLLFGLIHWSFSQILEENLVRGIFSAITLFFFSLWFSLYSESIQATKVKQIWFQSLAIIYSSLYFLFFDATGINDIEEIVFFFLSLTGIIWFLYFAPYIKNILSKNAKQSVYYTYFYSISVVFLLSFIFGGILMILWFIWITAVHTLFDLSGYFSGEIYGDWAIIAGSIITPIFAISMIPEKKDFTNNYFNENAFFSFLVKYIAIPFIYIYFIILYAYSVKVLSNFGDWPKGEVSWMVIVFSIFGYITYVFSYIFEEKNKYICVFRKYFPYVVIPQIFMLFYAIYLRISQYDVTINRYFVVIFGLWLLCISIYYAISKKKYLGHLFTSLTIFTIIVSIGPWGVYSLPESRQYDRLVENLQQANILQENGEIIPLQNKNEISKELSKNIYSGIDYLCYFDNCEKIKELFPKIYQKTLDEHIAQQEQNKQNNPDYKYYNSEPSSWEIINDISQTIKVEWYFSQRNFESQSTFYIHTNDNIFPLDTTWIQTVYEINSYNSQNQETSTDFQRETGMMKISNNNRVITNINYKKIKENILKKVLEKQSEQLDIWELQFEISNDYGDFVIILTSITIENPNIDTQKNTVDVFSFNGYLLEK